MQVILSVKTVEKAAKAYKDSYFTAAVSFTTEQDKIDVELDSDAIPFLELADEVTLTEKRDYLGIHADDFSRILLKNLLETNKDSPTIIGNYVREFIRLHMYEEFQTYVFSQLTYEEFSKFYKTHKDLLTVDFMTAYPFLNKENSTFLILVCYSSMNKLALKMLETGQAMVGHVNDYGNTALILACSYKMSDVALKLIEMGQANVGQANNDCSDTALLWACSSKMFDVALKLIETGQANVGQANKDGSTALIVASLNNMSDVAIKLIETGQANVRQENNLGHTALILARKHNMTVVVDKILGTI